MGTWFSKDSWTASTGPPQVASEDVKASLTREDLKQAIEEALQAALQRSDQRSNRDWDERDRKLSQKVLQEADKQTKTQLEEQSKEFKETTQNLESATEKLEEKSKQLEKATNEAATAKKENTFLRDQLQQQDAKIVKLQEEVEEINRALDIRQVLTCMLNAFVAAWKRKHPDFPLDSLYLSEVKKLSNEEKQRLPVPYEELVAILEAWDLFRHDGNFVAHRRPQDAEVEKKGFRFFFRMIMLSAEEIEEVTQTTVDELKDIKNDARQEPLIRRPWSWTRRKSVEARNSL